MTDNLCVGKISAGEVKSEVETDHDLAHRLWPPEAGELNEQPSFLLATAHAKALAARILGAIDPDELRQLADELSDSALKIADKVEGMIATDTARLRDLVSTLMGAEKDEKVD
jgi:hypothetical protein